MMDFDYVYGKARDDFPPLPSLSFHDTNTTVGAEIAEKFGVTEMEVTDEVLSPISLVFSKKRRIACIRLRR